MRILFLKALCIQSEMVSAPPLGQLLILSYCRERAPRHQYSFSDFHSDVTDPEKQMELISETRPDIVGLTAVTDDINDVLGLAGRIKGLFPDCRIVLGGHHTTAKPDDDYPNIDTIVIGEGEAAFLDLLEMAENGESWPPVYQTLTHLSDIDFPPAWDLAGDLSIYRMTGRPFIYHPNASIIASRGCPYQCTFCSSSMWRRAKPFFRFRSPKSVVDEIEHLLQKYGIRNFVFQDDALNGNVGHLDKMLDEMIRRRLKIRWESSFVGDERHLPEYLFPKLKESGCVGFNFGVESGSPRVLKSIRKNINLDEVNRALTLTKKHGLYNSLLFMVGNAWYGEDGRPDGETVEDLEMSYQFIRKVADAGLLYYLSLSIARPYPGSEMGRLVEEFGLADNMRLDDRDALERRVITFHHPHLTEEQVQYYYQKIWSHVSLHPRVIMNQIALIKNWDELKRISKIAMLQVRKLAVNRKVFKSVMAGKRA
ncbi:MAG: radical SAM protein [Rhodospirillales bacterium]